MIQFENVGLRYGVGPEVLRDVSFTLEPASFHFLTGPSGAGKTSLLKLLYIGLKPTRGLISMFGQTINSLEHKALSAIRRQIGVVFQEFRLLPHLSSFDNVALPLRISGTPEDEIKNNVNELLDWVGLGDYKNALPQTLSGGQQQRIAIARAVVARPKLLLADEPTGNLDDDIGLRLLNLFDQLNRMGTTVILATHNQQMMEQFNHPRLTLDNGALHITPPQHDFYVHDSQKAV
jgi:cell division transport system ATP-binding protein